MNSLPEIFFFAIVFYILYRFIFNFVVPIARTTRQVKQQFRNMQEMHQQQQGHFQDAYGPYTGQTGSFGGHRGEPQASTSTRHGQPGSAGTNKGGEYIDFEEIK
jgi:lipopolysaccharide export LptBFGC system permease protein LptF